MSQESQASVAEFEAHFEAMYLKAIPRLLDEAGSHLAFLSILSAIDGLAGLYAPKLGSGARFKRFVEEFFPAELQGKGQALWEMRNLMVHSFNAGPFALVCGQPHKHLTPWGDATILNGESFFRALQFAASAYFARIRTDSSLLESFLARVRSDDGGAPDVVTVVEYELSADKPT